MAKGNLRALQIKATETCKARGHRMAGWLKSPNGYGGVQAISECYECKAYVIVDNKPAPNGIDIGGSAVASDCPHKKES